MGREALDNLAVLATSGNGLAPAPSAPQADAGPPHALAALTLWQWIAVGKRLQITDRQRDIVRLIMLEDLKRPEIAKRLGIKESSIKTQIQRMYKKLGIRSRSQLFMRVWAAVEAMQHAKNT